MPNHGTIELNTARLLLRRFTIEDAEAVYEKLASDANVTRFLGWDKMTNIDIAKIHIRKWINQYDNFAYYNWAIVTLDSNEVIGNIAVVNLDDALECATLGYCLAHTFWGQGIMVEALNKVIDYLMSAEDIERVEAYYDIANPRSGRVMQKVGMIPEGIVVQGAKDKTGTVDKGLYYVTKEQRFNKHIDIPKSCRNKY